MDSGYILYIEDNRYDEELTRIAFEKGHLANEIIVIHDGVEALDYLSGQSIHGDLPQLILLDLKLPKLDGMSVLKRLRADPLTRSLPVLVLTTSVYEEALIDRNLDSISYLSKPVTFESFVDAVRRLRIYWMVVDMVAPGLIS